MPDAEIKMPDEFASTMQLLVAEAAKTFVPVIEQEASPDELLREELALMQGRIGALEQSMSAGFEKLAALFSEAPANQASQWERVDGNLRALRNTESVNQRLFNSLHEELRGYRDNFLRDSLQKPVIRDLILLFDDLTVLAAQMENSGAGDQERDEKPKQWSSNLENVIHAVVEILQRLEVHQIEPKEKADRALHKVVSFEAAETAEEEGLIVRRLKAGFVWRKQVMRAEEVVVKRLA
ncbi:MAG: nucleotide exchange factor GrpE [Chthoniobacterales bacterium]